MPNFGKGGNKRKKGKKAQHFDRELVTKDELEEYGQVLRLYGDCRVEIQCNDGPKRLGHVRRKVKRVALGDIVLVAIREFEKEKCDILIRYTEDEVRQLKSLKEIPDSMKVKETEDQTGGNELGEDLFEFEKKTNDISKKNITKERDDDLDPDDEDPDWIKKRFNQIRGEKNDYDKEDKNEDEEEEKENEDEDEQSETSEEARLREQEELIRKQEIEKKKKEEKEKKEKERLEKEKEKEILKEYEKNKKNKEQKPKKGKGVKDDKKEKVNIDAI